MREKLTHALFIANHLEIHVDLEITRVVITVRSFQDHPQIVYRAEIAFTDVDHDTRIFSLGDSDLTVFIFGFKD